MRPSRDANRVQNKTRTCEKVCKKRKTEKYVKEMERVRDLKISRNTRMYVHIIIYRSVNILRVIRRNRIFFHSRDEKR